MLRKIILYMVLSIISVPSVCSSQSISDYLILKDIGNYKLDKPEKFFPGEPPIGGPSESQSSGIITPTGHFKDHSDMTYEVMYLGDEGLTSPTVQVTQHTGDDSDQWLLHEVEDGFRKNSTLNAELVSPNPLRNISGQLVYYTWGYYRWLSNNTVISIQFNDITGTKPEPIEVVQAYLPKYPSTIPANLVLDQAHSEKWIKDEMERRLWLGDKWFAWQAAGNSTIPATLQKVSDNITVFLDYRQKYFGLSGDSDKENLFQLVSSQNLQGMKDKLAEYKSWWADNKAGSISLP